MILTCPDCATRYSTTPEAIGHNGRTVRCSKCNNSWFVSSEPDIMELKAQESEEQIIRETPIQDVEPDIPSTALTDTAEAPEVGAHVHIRDMADQKRRNKRLMGISMVWLLLLAALAAAAFYAVMNRQSIVEKYPKSASIYQFFGFNVNAIGLAFEEPVIRRLPVDGVNTLVVNGHIVNITNETREIPMLELSIVNGSDEVLASWAIEPPQPSLAAGGRIEYSSEYPNPPVDSDSIEYRFLTDDEEIIDPVSPPEMVEDPVEEE